MFSPTITQMHLYLHSWVWEKYNWPFFFCSHLVLLSSVFTCTEKDNYLYWLILLSIVDKKVALNTIAYTVMVCPFSSLSNLPFLLNCIEIEMFHPILCSIHNYFFFLWFALVPVPSICLLCFMILKLNFFSISPKTKYIVIVLHLSKH
jgi:hypothetical protein